MAGAGGAPDHPVYRPDIDGLRALAVVPVVLFHEGVPGMAGGFVGVDVFFVISGYLITSIILRQIALDRFSLQDFYIRRLRRIVPNLLLMIFAVTCLSFVILLPADLIFYCKSAIATLASLSNVLFWYKLNYFSPASIQIPLLNTWSLGVEEQYYLVFPLLLMVVSRWHARVPLIIVTLLAASLALSQYQLGTSPQAAFYLPFARWWELMLGSLLARDWVPRLRSHLSRETTSAAGLIAILAAILLYDGNTPFPGLAALLPCLGAACLIHANLGAPTREPICNRMLAWRPFVYLGQRSYSLYLWHWPIIVLTLYVVQRDLSSGEKLVLLGVMLAASFAAYTFVEQRFRRPDWPVRRLLLSTGAGAVVVVALAALGVATVGLPQRYPASIRPFATADGDVNPRRGECDQPSLEQIEGGLVCRIGPPSQPPRFALVGDSFGDAMMPGVAAAAQRAGVSGLVFVFSGCAPLVGVDEAAGACWRKIRASYDKIHATPSIRSVILIGRWSTFITGVRYGRFAFNHRVHLVDMPTADAPIVASQGSGNADVMRRGFVRSAAAVYPAKLWIVHGLAEQNVIVPQAATLSALLGYPLGSISARRHAERETAANDVLSRLSTVGNIRLIDATPVMCNAAECPIVASGRALYSDDNHPSLFGALRLAGIFSPALQAIGEPRGH